MGAFALSSEQGEQFCGLVVGAADRVRHAGVELGDLPGAEPKIQAQIRTAGVRSGTNVLGLVKHLTFVERFYFLGEDVRDWDATMQPDPAETIDSVTAAYREAIRRSNEIIETYSDLAFPAPQAPRKGKPPSMRWLLVHMIEETGRHAGQADILREQIDGSTGR